MKGHHCCVGLHPRHHYCVGVLGGISTVKGGYYWVGYTKGASLPCGGFCKGASLLCWALRGHRYCVESTKWASLLCSGTKSSIIL